MNHKKGRVKTGVIGIGRIGQVHLDNLLGLPELVEVTAVCDPNLSCLSNAKDKGIPFATRSYDELIQSGKVEAILICSPTPTHVQIIREAVKAGIHIFCEKPVDISLEKIREAIELVASSDSKIQVGFNRRFDTHFRRARERVINGTIGKIQMLKITSRDPSPPPTEYIQSSGGLFMDMTIHDFDMARFIVDSKIREVYATGRVLIDPAIGDSRDIDTAMVILGFQDGTLAHIDNSRKAIYGYDQRLEAFGANGLLQVGNMAPDTLTIHDPTGKHSSPPYSFFMDRYPQSYRDEIVDFIQCIQNNRPIKVGLDDAFQACAVALACQKSLIEKREVLLTEIWKDHAV